MTSIERLERFSMPVPEGGCWVWLGGLNLGGYGRFDSHTKAHRASWQAHRGPIPTGLHVLHRCDVRCCINPSHLFLGTHHDNMKDMWAKRRHRPVSLPGESHPMAKLTQAQVDEIRASAPYTRGLAKKFGVSNSRISAIRNRQSWR